MQQPPVRHQITYRLIEGPGLPHGGLSHQDHKSAAVRRLGETGSDAGRVIVDVAGHIGRQITMGADDLDGSVHAEPAGIGVSDAHRPGGPDRADTACTLPGAYPRGPVRVRNATHRKKRFQRLQAARSLRAELPRAAARECRRRPLSTGQPGSRRRYRPMREMAPLTQRVESRSKLRRRANVREKLPPPRGILHHGHPDAPDPRVRLTVRIRNGQGGHSPQ